MNKYAANVRRMVHGILPRRRLAGRVLLCGALLLSLIGCVATVAAAAASRPTVYKIVLSDDSSTVYSTEQLAAAAGLEIGAPLYAKTDREIADAILTACPDLQSVEAEKAENSGIITLKITEKQSFFYVASGSDAYLTDASMTLLRCVSATDVPAGLIRLAVPAASVTDPGAALDFGDDTAYYQSFVDTVLQGSLASDVTGIALEKRYDLKIMLEDRIILCWGTTELSDEKTALCLAMLQDSMFDNGAYVTVDVSDPARAVARPLYSQEACEQAFSSP